MAAALIQIGIGINNDALRGTKRWFFNYENVLFSRIQLYRLSDCVRYVCQTWA